MDRPKASVLEVAGNSSQQICQVCEKQFSKYTCPRCFATYCSVVCYKSHSEKCTESFATENIQAALKNEHVSKEDKAKMLNTLKRIYDESDDKVDEGPDEYEELERLERLAFEDKLTIDCLSEKQRNKFLEALEDGSLSVSFWEPWWTLPSQRGLSDQNTKSWMDLKPSRLMISELPLEVPDLAPDIYRKITPFVELCSETPSPLLFYCLCDILYGYCYATRLYNGEQDDLSELTRVALFLSTVMTDGKIHENIESAINTPIERTMHPNVKSSLVFSISIIRDIAQIAYQKDFILRSLSHFRSFIVPISKESRLSSKGKRKPTKIAKQAQAFLKKFEYYLSWVNCKSESEFLLLGDQIVEIWKTKMYSLENISTAEASTKDSIKIVI